MTIPEALGAHARVAVDRIHALGPMAAPVGCAVVTVHLAELPAVARETFAPGTQRSEAVLWPGQVPAALAEIGRASCRERVSSPV